jgi:hypothetical protein
VDIGQLADGEKGDWSQLRRRGHERCFMSIIFCLLRRDRCMRYRSQIHECAISLRFLGIILRGFSDLRFLYGFLKPFGRGYGFLSGFPPFSLTVYSN